MHAPSIGYCQGMNYLTAMLLMVLAKDEVKAFWVLVSLLGEDGEISLSVLSHVMLFPVLFPVLFNGKTPTRSKLEPHLQWLTT